MSHPKIAIVAGLGFGDEAKGSITEFLAREIGAAGVVRYNGGSQAGHTIRLPNGKSHTFSQFGCGTFIPGVKTFLTKEVLVNPLNLMREEVHLRELGINDAFPRLHIDPRAVVTTPYHVAMNRIREDLRSRNRHGSCGMGIGETVQDRLNGISLTIRDLHTLSWSQVRDTLNWIRNLKYKEASNLPIRDSELAMKNFVALGDESTVDQYIEAYLEFLRSGLTIYEVESSPTFQESSLVFEGAQGVLLDQDFGFAPYNTWTDITWQNAMTALRGKKGSVSKIGVLRAYMTRHGAGPFVTEDPELKLEEPNNSWSPWQESFRIGHFDLVAAKYAIEVLGGIDELAITHLDRIKFPIKVCTGYKIEGKVRTRLMVKRPFDMTYQLNLTDQLFAASPVYEEFSSLERFFERIETELDVSITITSNGPTYLDKVRSSRHA